MVWPMVIAAGISAAGSMFSANKASSAAKKASKEANKIAKAELDFAMERYDDWQAVFGPIQDTLSNYYNNLTPELITAQGLENYELEKDTALTHVRETLAQRGLGTSGLAAGVELQTELASAETRARIRAEAPMKVAQQQMSFLNAGLGSGENAANGVQGVLSGQAQTAAQVASNAGAAAGKAQGAATSAVTDFITSAVEQFGNTKKAGV